MKRCIFFITVMILFSTYVNAGEVRRNSVYVDVLYAEGIVSSARFSDNDIEAIGCGTSNWLDGFGGILFQFNTCFATNSQGESVVCYTENKDLIAQIQSITDSSWIAFRADENGDCSALRVSNNSIFIY